uniref:Uncharacterized protein n=1 Tax=viral metagenome TaxID=1070528 RepID=A0A6C0JUR2_9ZZZZ
METVKILLKALPVSDIKKTSYYKNLDFSKSKTTKSRITKTQLINMIMKQCNSEVKSKKTRKVKRKTSRISKAKLSSAIIPTAIMPYSYNQIYQNQLMVPNTCYFGPIMSNIYSNTINPCYYPTNSSLKMVKLKSDYQGSSGSSGFLGGLGDVAQGVVSFILYMIKGVYYVFKYTGTALLSATGFVAKGALTALNYMGVIDFKSTGEETFYRRIANNILGIFFKKGETYEGLKAENFGTNLKKEGATIILTRKKGEELQKEGFIEKSPHKLEDVIITDEHNVSEFMEKLLQKKS